MRQTHLFVQFWNAYGNQNFWDSLKHDHFLPFFKVITFNAPICIYIKNSAIFQKAKICKHKSTNNIKFMPFWLDLTFINMLDNDNFKYVVKLFVAQILYYYIFTISILKRNANKNSFLLVFDYLEYFYDW